MNHPDKIDLDQQIELLIEDAPSDGATKRAMAQAVAPVLKEMALQMQHLEYYILQGLDGGWVLTTLRNRARPDLEKTAIYAFATFKDAIAFQGSSKSKVIAAPIPITHILFQLFALDRVDSLIVMETPGDLAKGKEIHRDDLQKLVRQKLQQFQQNSRKKSGNLPPDIA